MKTLKDIEENLRVFVSYVKKNMKGYEKGEAQLFLERLFQSFGNKGILEAGASLEAQVKIDITTKFCDLLWPEKVLIEMKSSKEKNLAVHFTQAKNYWNELYDDQTDYVILCNFDEFWVYNWRHQRDPVSKVKLEELPEKWRSLAFLLPEEHAVKTHYIDDKVLITKEAAEKIANLFTSLQKRGIKQDQSQYFTLQCLVALFADDTNLFPIRGFFQDIIEDCLNDRLSSYDIFPLLFKQMNSKTPASGGRFKGVRFFNGGIFNKIYQIELTHKELKILLDASKADWSKVSPSIFGNIFEHSLSSKEQHRTGSHYTPENDILRIVEPTLIIPLREKITKAKTLKNLLEIKREISAINILDPACGSGNFLYIAYRELKQLELELFNDIVGDYKSISTTQLSSNIKGSQFFGIDTNSFAIELAKITLSFAKILTIQEKNEFNRQLKLDGFLDIESKEDPLPFENLDDNFYVGDSLKVDWFEADIIIGNPPFQSKNKMQQEFGADYTDEIRSIFPNVSGFADYCVYWFRKAHNNLKLGGRAGLVGTNTISQTNSREGGLDYIVSNNGIIINAIKTMPWQGTSAVVSVSIVNWIKTNNFPKSKKLIQILRSTKEGWQKFEVDRIPSSLSPLGDVTKAKKLKKNRNPKTCYQGQTHGHKGFLLSIREASKLIKANPYVKDVIFPFLGANQWLADSKSIFDRYVIDFKKLELFQAQKYPKVLEIVKDKVLPTRKSNYEKEQKRNAKLLAKNPDARINRHHENFLKKWWRLSYPREDLLNIIANMPRYIVVSQVTRRPIFDFISSNIHPNASLVVFTFNDDYTYGILQSTLHWIWTKERCSTLTERIRYTSTTIYETFPFPQWGLLHGIDLDKNTPEKIKLVKELAKCAKKFRDLKNKIRINNKLSLRDLYRGLELPGDHPLKKSQEKLDEAVWKVYYYGLPKNMQKEDPLEFLLGLNLLSHEKEKESLQIVGPGLPSFCNEDKVYFSDDTIGLKGIEGD